MNLIYHEYVFLIFSFNDTHMNTKIFWLFVTFWLVACTTEPMPLQLSIDKTKFTENETHSTEKVMTSTLQNTTNRTAIVAWDFAKQAEVTGWTYQISINGTLQTTMSGSFDMEAEEEVTLSVTINPNGKAGASSATLTLLEGATQLGAIEYTYMTTASPKFSLSTNTASGSGPVGGHDPFYEVLVTNLTSAPLHIKWHKVVTSPFPTWGHACKDYFLYNCLGPMIISREYTIDANITYKIETIFYTGNVAGTGSIATHFFEPSDSATTVQTFTATHTAF